MDLQNFGVSIYLIQVIFGAVDFPAKVVVTVSLSYVGRRLSLVVAMFLAGLVIVANIFVPTGGCEGQGGLHPSGHQCPQLITCLPLCFQSCVPPLTSPSLHPPSPVPTCLSGWSSPVVSPCPPTWWPSPGVPVSPQSCRQSARRWPSSARAACPPPSTASSSTPPSSTLPQSGMTPTPHPHGGAGPCHPFPDTPRVPRDPP